MINSRQRELAARNKFSFTDPADELAFKTWAEGMEGRYSSFGKPGGGAWSRRSFHKTDDEDESAVPSPKLWEQMEEKAEEKSVMAGYRKEMMELVKDVPDSAYELSLKDLVVELPMTRREEGEAQKGLKKKGVERRMSRKESMEAGFLLRMSLPFSLGWRRKKNESSVSGSKVSPKPVLGGREKGGSDGGRSSSNGSSNSTSSTSSGNGKLSACFSFFFPHKSRARRIRREHGVGVLEGHGT